MAYARSSYWSLSDRDRCELASWQLAAARAQALPVTAFFELHGGGRTDDTLHLDLHTRSPAEDYIKINRRTAGRPERCISTRRTRRAVQNRSTG